MKLLSVKEVADILSVRAWAVRGLVNSGKLTCYRLNARTFKIPAESVQTFLESCKMTPDTELAKEILAEETSK